ncbi:unnamed protein product [Enterobius vermicularis]|uniref:R3H-assoc domain-containing protein n=1 Tax=Enterobius vermicularis TaxID=51028 RepID=A0A158QAN9_ENTVE|nr:unnamed protein product [Enterobius vermicularis]
MGSGRQCGKKKRPYNAVWYTDEWGYVFDDSEEEEIPDAVVTDTFVNSLSSCRRKKQRVGRAGRRIRRLLDKDCLVGTVKEQDRVGNRKYRRLENAKLIYALADPNDICEDFSDLVPETVSAFALLFIDQSNMKAWNDFIEKDEEEQEAFLRKADNYKNDDLEDGGHYASSSAERRNKDKWVRENLDRDSRSHHPAYSAAACFSRLDVHFKNLFYRRELPWTFINDIEDMLRQFFISHGSKEAKWISDTMPSAWHRLLLHGVSQYLSLRSRSFVNDLGGKFVKVYNPRPFFVPPHRSLSSFLAQKRKDESFG